MFEWVDNPASIDPTFSTLPPDEQQAILAFLKQERAQMMARDVSTTTSPTAVGFTRAAQAVDTSKFAGSQRRPRKSLAEKVAEEAAVCEGCTGTCPKTEDRWRYPKIEFACDLETVNYYTCKFGITRKRQRELNQKLRSSRIPTRYIGKTFDDYKVDNSNRNAVTFAKQALNSNVGAYFFGECGTGKTFLAALIAQEFLQDGKSVIFIKVPSLLDDIKATFDGKGRELDLLDELRTANLVVLDDFGMEKPTQWAGSTLCKVLDMRYDNPPGRTIITSNLSPKELAEHLNNANDGANLNGSRIADRLREICKPILLKGTSRRN